MKSEKMRGHLKWFWREWAKPLLTILLVLGAVRSSLADWNDVPTGSMRPTICEGDRIWVNKLAYDLKVPFTIWRLAQWGNPQRGDIVVLFSPQDGKRLVKRVVGLPGDTVAMKEEQILINGTPVHLAPVNAGAYDTQHLPNNAFFVAEHLADHLHPITVSPSLPSVRTFDPVRVPAGQYFVMGDNRDNSLDSRFFGCVARERILGEATHVVLSFNPDRFYLPRWQRFFKLLL